MQSFLRYTQTQKYYSKGEVNAVKITQKRLHKMKKNVAMVSFYCLFSKIWKKLVFYVVVTREKKLVDFVVSQTQKTNIK